MIVPVWVNQEGNYIDVDFGEVNINTSFAASAYGRDIKSLLVYANKNEGFIYQNPDIEIAEASLTAQDRRYETSADITVPQTDTESQYYSMQNGKNNSLEAKKQHSISVEDTEYLDPVTYNDNGNVIPLSERFNSEESDIRYSISDNNCLLDRYERGEISREEYQLFKDIEKYTETQYINFGWITVNKVVTSAEREILFSRYADYKHNKNSYPTTRFGEAVIHSYDCPDVIAYIKGKISNPEITKIVRINADEANDILAIREVVLSNEYKQEPLPYKVVESYFGESHLNISKKRDYASFRSIKAGAKGRSSAKSDTDSGTGKNGAGILQQNKADDRADSVESAFSIPENDRNKYSVSEKGDDSNRSFSDRVNALSVQHICLEVGMWH